MTTKEAPTPLAMAPSDHERNTNKNGDGAKKSQPQRKHQQ
jgi:hypothetical protein